MKYNQIPSELFVRNRARFAEQLQSNAIAIFHSNDVMPRSGDGFHPFKQNADLFFLSGIDQEETILVLYPDAPEERFREMLFIRETNESIRTWEGEKLSKEEARALSGIQNVNWTNGFHSAIQYLMTYTQSVYLNLNENDRSGSDVVCRDLRYARDLKDQFPLHTCHRSAPILAELRSVKQEEEIAQIQQACAITETAFKHILNVVKPGMHEYEIEAEITYQFLKNRATGHAYDPIVASGENACILHYVTNNKICKEDDLLLLDFGAEYANYAADLTRTIPVNGTFTDRQRTVYDACLRVQKEAISILQPGITWIAWNEECGKIMESALIDIGLLSKQEVSKQDKKAPLYKKYYPHGIGHPLGLDVHDVGNRYAPIQENMVFTVEPGIYIPQEGIGIRIENDVVVQSGGNIDLMKNTPREADEIEALMS